MSASEGPPTQRPDAIEVVVLCPTCHTRNNATQSRCSHCGAELHPSLVSETAAEPPADAASMAEMEVVQHEIEEVGLRLWVGYCRTCKQVVTANVNQRCEKCGTRLKGIQEARPDEREQAVAVVHQEHMRRRRSKSLTVALALLALVAFIIVPLVVLVPRVKQQMTARATPTPTMTRPPSTPGAFSDSVFSFRYPPAWWVIGPAEVSVLLATLLKGMTSEQYGYIGGVFLEGMDDCKACAQIVVMVATDKSFVGTLTDAQYDDLREASAQALGSRLLAHRKLEVASMPAAESVYRGLSGDTQVLEYTIIPPQPGLAYMVTCSSHKDTFASFEPVFRQAISTLRIAAGGPAALWTPVRTATPRPTRTPLPRFYVVQPGDVLGQIAKDLGVSLEALAEANGLADPYIIQPGQVLTIPLGAR